MIEVLEEREFLGYLLVPWSFYLNEKWAFYEHLKFHFGGSVMPGNYVILKEN